MYMSDRATDMFYLKPGTKNKAEQVYGGGNILNDNYTWNSNPDVDRDTLTGKQSTVPQQQAAPQPAYDPYAAYMDYMRELEERQRAAREQAYQAAAGQQKQNYGYAQNQLNGATDKALQEAYINKMLTLKNMPQQLTAQGLNGGASESTLGSMHNNYANARNGLENERQTQLAALLNAYQNNMAQLEAQRASGEAASLSELTPQVMQLAAQNGVPLVNLVQSTGQTYTTNGSKKYYSPYEEEY